MPWPFRRRRRRRLIALVAFRDEMRFLPGFFADVGPQVDGIVALDDGSTDGSGDWVAAQPGVLELLRVEPGAQAELEDGVNHRALTEAAWGHGADWLLGLDADERLERDFRARAEQEIDRAEAAGHDALWVWFRELWGAPDRVRTDGLWGGKRKACLYRSDPAHVFDARRVHAHWASLATPVEQYPQGDLLLYHLRMIDAADRAARVARYDRIDPEHEWQAIGYDYLLDEQGIVLEPLPPGRGYRNIGT